MGFFGRSGQSEFSKRCEPWWDLEFATRDAVTEAAEQVFAAETALADAEQGSDTYDRANNAVALAKTNLTLAQENKAHLRGIEPADCRLPGHQVTG